MPSERAKRCAAWVQTTHPFIVAEQLVSARLARKRLRMKERQHLTNIRALVDKRDTLASRVRELEAAIRDVVEAFDVDSLVFDDFESVIARAWALLPEVNE